MDTAPDMLAYRYRLYPTPDQEQMFLQISGCCRMVSNLALEAHLAAYAKDGTTLSAFDLNKEIPGWKKARPFLKTPPAQTLQAAIRDLGDAWARFFKGQNARPTWRKHGEDPHFRLPQPEQFKIRRLKGHKKSTHHLFLPKMGMSGTLGPVKMVLHRPLDGKVKNLTIKREGGFWYAAFTVERAATAAPVRPEGWMPRVRGADRGVRTPVADSDGCILGASIATPKLLAKLARLQRVVARKNEARREKAGVEPGGSLKGVPKSGGLRRAEQRLSKFYGHLARKRKDQAHKIANALLDGADVVAFEALDTPAMTSTDRADSSPALRRGILDVGWGMIASFTAYKARWAHKTVVRVNPAYTSQTCVECGHVAAESRKGSRFCCVACGHTDHADTNAARVIRARAMAAWRDTNQGAGGYTVPQMWPEGTAPPSATAEPNLLALPC